MKMTELTAAIDEARALHEFREKQQVETIQNITEQLEEQTRLADEAEKELNTVKFDSILLLSQSDHYLCIIYILNS